MIPIYLVTGFLGSGKTTFMQHFITIFNGKKLRIIVNEFGKAGVDGKLLEKYDTSVQEIVGGSIFCMCRMDRFEQTLDEVLKSVPEIVLVESSGLSDPTDANAILSKGGKYEYKGCICIADAIRLPKVYETARVCKKQLAAADVIILNKLDIASDEEADMSRKIIHMMCGDTALIETTFGRIPSDWKSKLLDLKSRQSVESKYIADLTHRQTTICISTLTSSYELTHFIKMFAEDTYRIKGILKLSDGCYMADAVSGTVAVREIPQSDYIGENRISVLYDAAMPALCSIKSAFKWYPNIGHID